MPPKQKEDFFKRYKENYGIDLNKEGYSRIGTSNPYNGEVYYKYYGPDGKLIAAQWQDDAQGWQKAQNDFSTARKRQRDQQDIVKSESTSLSQFDNKFQQSRTSTTKQLTTLDNAVKRVDFAGSWSGNDDRGNWLRFVLNRDGTTRYRFGLGNSTNYDGTGTWRQVGGRITMRTDDGNWFHESTITDTFRLQFNERHRTGTPYTNYLSR